jgi:hypothetical protein
LGWLRRMLLQSTFPSLNQVVYPISICENMLSIP